MAGGSEGIGRGVERAVSWTVRNLDGVIAIAVAVAVGLLDIFSNVLHDDVVSGATLLVLAALVYGTLHDRVRRVADIRSATTGTQRALEDLTMVRTLAGAELEHALAQARRTTDQWIFKGGTGRYLRAVTLPECVREARTRRRSLTVKAEIVHPGDERACATYARFRQSFEDQHSAGAARWTPDRVRKESYATVMAACCHRQRLDTLEIDIHLSSVVPTLRFDLSATCLIITQDDPGRVSLLVERDRPLYGYYVTELHHSRDQAMRVDLRRAEPLGPDPTVDEVRRLFDALGLPLPTAYADRDVMEIIDKALRAENPYRV